MNHHQAKAIQQRDDRQQQRIGVGREAPDRQMCAREQCDEEDQVLDQVPAQTLLLVGLDDEQCHHRDECGKPEQEQFGVAPVGHWRHDGDRGLRLGGGHDAARQVVPGSCGGGGSAVTVGDGVGEGWGAGGGPGGAGAVTVVGTSAVGDGSGRAVAASERAVRREGAVRTMPAGRTAAAACRSWWSSAWVARRSAAARSGRVR